MGQVLYLVVQLSEQDRSAKYVLLFPQCSSRNGTFTAHSCSGFRVGQLSSRSRTSNMDQIIAQR